MFIKSGLSLSLTLTHSLSISLPLSQLLINGGLKRFSKQEQLEQNPVHLSPNYPIICSVYCPIK